MNVEQTVAMVIAACDAIIDNEGYLTEIDKKIGDGDHGTGMSLGMRKAKETLLEKGNFETVNDVFKTTGKPCSFLWGSIRGDFWFTVLGGIKEKEAITELDGYILQILCKIL